ncbi:MAG: hypothetical protein VYA44_08670 [SAR324 cluster bacterium]|nr:hypothetical protein [SAR324 cluster bacterium]MEC7887913.1 hypothetical protein [SAR324 cluster bacterium]
MANKKLTDSDLKLLLGKQESLLKRLLDFSQRQFAETDPIALDGLLLQKDSCFEEMQKVDSLLEKWFTQFDRALKPDEQILEQTLQDLLEKILISEQDFEKVVGREKKAVSLQIEELSRQMQYRKEPVQQRAKIKNMMT